MRMNKKGSIFDIMEAPFAIGFLLLIIAVFVFMIGSFNNNIQANAQVDANSKSISSELATFSDNRLPLLPLFLIIAVFAFTMYGAFTAPNPSEPLFILSFLVLVIYTLVMGIAKVFYLKLIEITLIGNMLAIVPFIPFYFEYLFIFQTAWFLLYFTIWGLRQ